MRRMIPQKQIEALDYLQDTIYHEDYATNIVGAVRFVNVPELYGEVSLTLANSGGFDTEITLQDSEITISGDTNLNGNLYIKSTTEEDQEATCNIIGESCMISDGDWKEIFNHPVIVVYKKISELISKVVLTPFLSISATEVTAINGLSDHSSINFTLGAENAIYGGNVALHVGDNKYTWNASEESWMLDGTWVNLNEFSNIYIEGVGLWGQL